MIKLSQALIPGDVVFNPEADDYLTVQSVTHGTEWHELNQVVVVFAEDDGHRNYTMYLDRDTEVTAVKEGGRSIDNGQKKSLDNVLSNLRLNASKPKRFK